PFRLAQGGRIDRNRPVHFRFDGQDHHGFAGDSLASALLARGESLFARSFKFHRPRGILPAGADEPNALVRAGFGPARIEPNARATLLEIFDQLEARSQNRFPFLGRDLAAIHDLLAPLLSAGFYYKLFHRPGWLWPMAEPVIRRLAGLGHAPA